MNKNYGLAAIYALLSIFWGYAVISAENRETLIYSSKNLATACAEVHNGSYVYFRDEKLEFRSRKFKTSCSVIENKIGRGWELGVKKDTSIVVYLKSPYGYLEGDESKSTVDLWMIFLFILGFLACLIYLYKGIYHR